MLDNLKKPFEIINQTRKQIGRQPFLWSDKLANSAQNHAEWLWSSYLRGVDITLEGHHGLQERLERSGYLKQGEVWADFASECGALGDSGATGEDGKQYPATESGWHYPLRNPIRLTEELMVAIATGDQVKDNPNEGHIRDFRRKWSHIGLGYKGGIFIIEYGIRE